MEGGFPFDVVIGQRPTCHVLAHACHIRRQHIPGSGEGVRKSSRLCGCSLQCCGKEGGVSSLCGCVLILHPHQPCPTLHPRARVGISPHPTCRPTSFQSSEHNTIHSSHDFCATEIRNTSNKSFTHHQGALCLHRSTDALQVRRRPRFANGSCS